MTVHQATAELSHDGVSISLAQLLKLRFYANQLGFSSQLSVSSLRTGEQTSRLLGRGLDFAQARPYQAGDDLRHMDWRIMARTGKPYTKEYEAARERPTYFYVDLSESMFFATRTAYKSVTAQILTALMAFSVLQQGDSVGALCAYENKLQHFPLASRSNALLPLFKFLSATQAERATPQSLLPSALQQLRRVAGAGSLLVLISDFSELDAHSEQQIKRLFKFHQVIAIHVYDPIEKALPQGTVFPVTDGQAMQALDTTQTAFVQAYQQQYAAKRQRLLQLFSSANALYIECATNDNPITLLKRHFTQRKYSTAELA